MASTKHFVNVLGMSTITVLVGEGEAQKTFVVHKELICARSDFFRASMKEGWKEGEEGVVPLPEDDPQVFALYVQSLYAGHAYPDKEVETSPVYYLLLGGTYVLAQKLLDVRARNMVVQAIFDTVHDKIHPEECQPPKEVASMIEAIWEVTTSDSIVRQLLVDTFVFYRMNHYSGIVPKSVELLLDCFKNLPVEYLSELSVAQIRKPLYYFNDRKFLVEMYLEEDPEVMN